MDFSTLFSSFFNLAIGACLVIWHQKIARALLNSTETFQKELNFHAPWHITQRMAQIFILLCGIIFFIAGLLIFVMYIKNIYSK